MRSETKLVGNQYIDKNLTASEEQNQILIGSYDKNSLISNKKREILKTEKS